jgi:N-acyl-D-aspartate/D-glutamate deacylase
VNDWDLVLRGGRVIDPESGLDAVRDVAVADGRIAAVGSGLPTGPRLRHLLGAGQAGGTSTAPRSAMSTGCSLLTRGGPHSRGGPLSLAQALAKCSLEPARPLEGRVPVMRGKGRLRGDEDIVVFDPGTVTDRASYLQSTRPSAGIRHVLVNGTFVVRDGDIVADARPGRLVRAVPHLSPDVPRGPRGGRERASNSAKQ